MFPDISGSATYQPTTVAADAYDVTFTTDRAVFDRRDGDIETHLEIVAVPRDRAQVRTITITNRSAERSCSPPCAVALMIENYRSELLWRLMRECSLS